MIDKLTEGAGRILRLLFMVGPSLCGAILAGMLAYWLFSHASLAPSQRDFFIGLLKWLSPWH